MLVDYCYTLSVVTTTTNGALTDVFTITEQIDPTTRWQRAICPYFGARLTNRSGSYFDALHAGVHINANLGVSDGDSSPLSVTVLVTNF